MDNENITREQILKNPEVFNFSDEKEVARYEKLLTDGFNLISRKLDKIGTPDSSRYWDKALYEKGKIREDSKEFFREMLQSSVPDKDVLLNKNRMEERKALAGIFRLKDGQMTEVGRLYVDLAEKITGKALPLSDKPREGILAALNTIYLIG